MTMGEVIFEGWSNGDGYCSPIYNEQEKGENNGSEYGQSECQGTLALD